MERVVPNAEAQHQHLSRRDQFAFKALEVVLPMLVDNSSPEADVEDVHEAAAVASYSLGDKMLEVSGG